MAFNWNKFDEQLERDLPEPKRVRCVHCGDGGLSDDYSFDGIEWLCGHCASERVK